MTICPDCKQPTSAHDAYKDGLCPTWRYTPTKKIEGSDPVYVFDLDDAEWARLNRQLDGLSLVHNAIRLLRDT